MYQKFIKVTEGASDGSGIDSGDNIEVEKLLRELRDLARFNSVREMCEIYAELEEAHGYMLVTETNNRAGRNYSAVFRQKD